MKPELEHLVQEIIRLAQEINALSDQLNERIEHLEDRLTQARVGVGAEGIPLPDRWELGYRKLGDRWCFVVARDGEHVALLKASRATRRAAWKAMSTLLRAIIERQEQVRDSLLVHELDTGDRTAAEGTAVRPVVGEPNVGPAGAAVKEDKWNRTY